MISYDYIITYKRKKSNNLNLNIKFDPKVSKCYHKDANPINFIMIKEKINFYIIVAFASILGIMTDYFFYGKSIGISFFIFTLLAIAFSVIVAQRFEQKLSKIQILLLLSAIILAAGVFLRASLFLEFFNITGGIYLLFLFFALFADEDVLNFRFLKYLTVPLILLFKSLSEAAKSIDKYTRSPAASENTGSKEFWSVIKGVLLSLPILIVLGLLLYSADSVFRIYLDRLSQIKIDLSLIARILKILIVSCFFIGIFHKIAASEKIKASEEKNRENKSLLGFIESATILALVEMLFLFFIAIQFFYLFGGKNYVWGIDEYITYSEYAKSGFYELIIVSVISLALIYAMDKLSKKETVKQKNIFKLLNAALFIEISVILFSAFTRLSVYVDGYGLTFSRFLAFAFLFWIFGIFTTFLYKILAEKKDGVFLLISFLFTITVWTSINMLNPDALIAKTNIDRLAHGKKLDPYYFSILSEDAVPEIVKIFKLNVNDEIKEKIAMDLDRKYLSRDYNCDIISYERETSDYYSFSQCKPTLFSERIKTIETKPPWQSFNLSKLNALQALKNNAGEIDKYEIGYWKKAAIMECENRAMNCEADCANNAWQPMKECKDACSPDSCIKFEQNVKLLK